jgi:hypothetical protein
MRQVKLNAQELRNAEFFGQFKTRVYELATEQLNRWRDWKVFSPDQIARMEEVEISGEFMLLIMSGILERKASTITDYYANFDDSFEEAKEVSARFRHVFDTIDALLPRDVIAQFFRTRAVFYPLFATVYGLQFGLQSPQTLKGRAVLGKGKPRTLRPGVAEQLKQAALAIRERAAPPLVLEALRGGVNHTPQRRAVIDHLAGDGNSPLPPLP